MESIEKEDLTKQVERLEQEGRMVLPGIQALFGFQLIAVFNNGFSENLRHGDQILHFIALFFTAISALLIMTPAAYHRQVEQGESSTRFIKLASRLICYSMAFLALALSVDVGIIAKFIFKDSTVAIAIGCFLFLIYVFAWIIFPKLGRHEHLTHHLNSSKGEL